MVYFHNAVRFPGVSRWSDFFRWAHQIWWIIVALFNLPGVLFAFNRLATKTEDFATDALSESSTQRIFAYLSVFNLTMTIVIRNELLLTLLYWSFNYVPVFKFQFHRMLHSIGGLHVGAGFATFVWILVYMINMFARTTFGCTWQEWIMRITIVIMVAGLSVMILTALRPIRERYHNLWEYTHRFVGWFTLLNLVLHVIAKSATSRPATIFSTPLPYLTLVCLISVFYIWFTAQQVPVEASSGTGVAIVKFPCRPTMKDGTFARVSTDFLQWHAFSVAMTNNTKSEFAIIVGAAGDWTRSLVNGVAAGHGPTRMWIRGITPPGFMHMHRILIFILL